jgi:Replication initiator protein A (RepA) N-terminus.
MERIHVNQFNTSENYFQLPKALFTLPFYKSMSPDAKLAYAFMKDRMKLSMENNKRWTDDDGYIFIYCKIEVLAEFLGKSKPTAIKIKQELQEYGLLEEVRQGLKQPNRLYVGNIVGNSDHIYHLENEQETVIHRHEASKDAEVKNFDIKKSKTLTSRSKESLSLEVKNFDTNKTELSKTEINKTESFKRIDDEDDIKETRAREAQLSELSILQQQLLNKWGVDYHELSPVQQNDLNQLVQIYGLDVVTQGIYRTAEYGGKSFRYLKATIDSVENETQQKIAQIEQEW